MSLFKFIFKHRTWRVSKASKFGKIEHKSGRLLGLCIAISGMCVWLDFPKGYSLSMIGITAACWITYISSHTIEKKLYGHFGPRG